MKQIATFPRKIQLLFDVVFEKFSKDPRRLLINLHDRGGVRLNNIFPCVDDDGYLIKSGVDPVTRSANIQLILIRDGIVLKTWQPDWENISAQAKVKIGRQIDINSAVAVHPLPLPNGDLFFNVQDVAVVIDSKSKSTVLDFVSHHSVELGNGGLCVITPSVYTGFFKSNTFLNSRLRDDSILTATIGGKIIDNLSFSMILSNNGLDYLMFGHSGLDLITQDPLHINQISVAHSDGAFWKKGDYLISARHLSAIFIFRPSENRIVWYQVGPWKNQHCVHFVDSVRIALLDNNVFGHDSNAPIEQNFVDASDINRVFVVDFSSGKPVITEPFKSVLELDGLRPRTVTEGRIRVMTNDSLFFEDTNNGRQFMIKRGRLVWYRLNQYNGDYIGRLSWGRYLTKEEGEKLLDVVGFQK